MNKSMMTGENQRRPQTNRIVKIKIKQGEFYFAWESFQSKTRHWDKHTLTCKDLPRPEFLEKMQVLANHVTEICEFAKEESQKLTVSGVSLSYTDKNNRYLVITAQKSLAHSKSPLIINTPARPEAPENEGDGEKFCWSSDLTDDIDDLEREAWKYIDGDRAQQTLDFDDVGGPAERNVA